MKVTLKTGFYSNRVTVTDEDGVSLTGLFACPPDAKDAFDLVKFAIEQSQDE